MATRDALETSGKAIWDSMNAEAATADQQALILQYARLADTSDRLAGLAAGRRDSWVELVYDEMGEIHLSVDKLLDQLRNTQLALKAVHSELRAAGLLVAASPSVTPSDHTEETPLERRRREKEQRERNLG